MQQCHLSADTVSAIRGIDGPDATPPYSNSADPVHDDRVTVDGALNERGLAYNRAQGVGTGWREH